MKRKQGQESLLTPALHKVIIEAIKRGNFAITAVRLAGITEPSFYNWLKRGATGEEPYASFAAAVEHASAVAEDDALKRQKAGEQGWQAHMTFLERRFHQRWGQKDALYDERKKQAKLDADKSKVEIETLKAKLKLLEAGQDPDAARVEFIVHHDAIEE